MTKKGILLLFLYCSLTTGAGIARAVDIQTGPLEQIGPSTSAGEKESAATIGPRSPEKEKPQGVGVNFIVNKNLAITSSASLLSPEPYLQTGQAVNSGGLGFSTSQVGGAVGLKIFFN